MLQVEIIGNIGNDAQVKDFNGKKYITFNVAHSEKFKNQQGVETERTPKKKRIYISGKMGESTLSDYTKKKFRKAEELLEKFGYDVFNPACEEWQYVLSQQAESAGLSGRAKYEMCLFLDIRELKKRDAIYMLEDWTSSPGAIAELSYALATGKEIMLESDIRKLITI